jgi:hypothetical protein
MKSKNRFALCLSAEPVRHNGIRMEGGQILWQAGAGRDAFF